MIHRDKAGRNKISPPHSWYQTELRVRKVGYEDPNARLPLK